jgi:hypothetical protein
MNNSAPFGRRGDGSFYVNLDWTPEVSPPTPAPPRRLSRARPSAGWDIKLSFSADVPRFRLARRTHDGKALRIDFPGLMSPL